MACCTVVYPKSFVWTKRPTRLIEMPVRSATCDRTGRQRFLGIVFSPWVLLKIGCLGVFVLIPPVLWLVEIKKTLQLLDLDASMFSASSDPTCNFSMHPLSQDSLDALSCQQALGRHERCGDYDQP